MTALQDSALMCSNSATVEKLSNTMTKQQPNKQIFFCRITACHQCVQCQARWHQQEYLADQNLRSPWKHTWRHIFHRNIYLLLKLINSDMSKSLCMSFTKSLKPKTVTLWRCYLSTIGHRFNSLWLLERKQMFVEEVWFTIHSNGWAKGKLTGTVAQLTAA